VKDELLTAHADEFAAAMEELEGKAQYVVKDRYTESTPRRGCARPRIPRGDARRGPSPSRTGPARAAGPC
jgi:hypothetical protein